MHLSDFPQARRITALTPNPPYPKTGFHFATINKALSEGVK